MVKRIINWRRHFTALAITLILFLVGIFIGIELSDERIQYTQTMALQQKLEYESLQLQMSHLAQNKDNCDLLLQTLERNLHDLEQQRFKLESFIADSTDEEYVLIKKEYILTEIRYWMLAKDAKTFCDADFVPVLFFYLRDEDCDSCSTQGHILTYVKEKLRENVLIFSLDAASDDPMIGLLKNTFNVTSTPSVVIDQTLYSGLTEKEAIMDDVCAHFTTPVDACKTT